MTKINIDPASHTVLAEALVTTQSTREVRTNSEGFTLSNLSRSSEQYLASIEPTTSTVSVTRSERNNSELYIDPQLTYDSLV